jgi:prolipoprotein diacylglyceryltransferase
LNFPYNPVIFGEEINSHFVAEVLAFIVGFRLYIYRKKKMDRIDAYSSEQRLIILVAATAGALVFSRIIGALENLTEWLESPNPWIYLYSVKTIAGGFIGGWLFVEIAKHFMKIKASSGDIMVYPIVVAIVIGRLGCFSQGVYDMTHGYPTSWFTGMDLGDGTMRHPLALYEIVVVIVIGIFIYLKNKRKPFRDGWQFKTFMLLYLLYRFITEYMKPHFPLTLGLTSIQIAIIATYIFNLRHLYSLTKNK